MSKKQAHNAFYYFMLDFKDKQGRKYNSLREVSEAAGPHWKNLNKEQRRKYEERATAAKGALKASRLNSDRRPIDEIENMEREEMEVKQQMKDDIQATLSFAKRANMLESHLFFIIHVNSFCQEEHTKEYSPCEIAIAGFSLKEGVVNDCVYHSMINPGPLPLGYASAAKQHSDETHQIELPKIGEEDEENQDQVFKEIIQFLSSKKRVTSEKFPILYATDKNLPMVKSVFESWCRRNDMDTELFQIYNLQYMFRILRNIVAGSDCWTSDTMSYQEIEKDVYNYTPDIACEFHQMADVLTYCSRSMVVRYAYIICDYCCPDANIQLIPGCHVPINSRISKQAYSDFKPVKSSRRTASSKYTSDTSVRDDTSDAETVISIGRSSTWEDTSSASSINFPELGRSTSGGQASQWTGDVSSPPESSNNIGGSDSYAGATSLRIGSSGFSKKPAALPFNVTEEMGVMSLSQESMDSHFPAIRGRGGPGVNLIVRGKGRGHPFRKPTS